MNDDKKQTKDSNANLQGVDKNPGEEQGKSEKVTKADLKGKKIDGDPSVETDRPVEQ